MGGLTVLLATIVCFMAVAEIRSAAIRDRNSMVCGRYSPCFGKRLTCPAECPHKVPSKPSARACYLNCYNPKCEAVCQHLGPICDGTGSGCRDPRFIGGDGVVFYFHGRKDEHFALVSNPNLQVNGRFIGLRPLGRNRDFTWIGALGILSGAHSLTVEATRASRWDETLDHLKFSFDGQDLEIPEGHRSSWKSKEDGEFTIQRIGSRNSVAIALQGIADVSVNVVPVTEDDDRIHGYQIPEDDCFAHLEVQFKFQRLSDRVDGVLGRTYRTDYESPAKRGVAMAVLGGDDKFRTSALLSSDCKSCVFDRSMGGERLFRRVGDQ